MLRRWAALMLLLIAMLTVTAVISTPSHSPPVLAAAVVVLAVAAGHEVLVNQRADSHSVLMAIFSYIVSILVAATSFRHFRRPQRLRRGWSTFTGYSRSMPIRT